MPSSFTTLNIPEQVYGLWTGDLLVEMDRYLVPTTIMSLLARAERFAYPNRSLAEEGRRHKAAQIARLLVSAVEKLQMEIRALAAGASAGSATRDPASDPFSLGHASLNTLYDKNEECRLLLIEIRDRVGTGEQSEDILEALAQIVALLG